MTNGKVDKVGGFQSSGVNSLGDTFDEFKKNAEKGAAIMFGQLPNMLNGSLNPKPENTESAGFEA